MKLEKAKKQYFLKRNWYFQGFNGTPALLSGPTIGNVKEGFETLGYGYSHIIEFFEGDKCYYLYDWDDLQKNLQEIINRTKKDQKYPLWLVAKDKELRELHEKLVKKLEKIDISKLPFKEALRLYHEFGASYRKAISVSLIIECFTYPTEEIIRTMITEELTKQGKAKEFEKVSALLGEAVHPSFIGKYQLELLRIAADIKKAGMYEVCKCYSTKDVEKKIQSHKKIAETIHNLQQRYFWMNNAYAGTKILPVSHFVHDIQEICKKFEEPEQEDKRIQTHFTTLQKRKKQACEKYHLSDELQQLMFINDNIGIIHDYRKEVITYANYFIDEFIKRIANEKHIPHDLMRYVSELECKEDILAAITAEVLEERKKVMVHIVTSQQEEYIFSGKEAEEFIQEVSEQHQHQEEEILKGYCASQGHVRGKVKVCRGLTEIAKFEEGNVLVACMTQPEFVPAMKKAIAVVTDEGGLTCHAAIISRELGKPCVISTKKATKVLKDGMIVDVNATEGIVRIIKKT